MNVNRVIEEAEKFSQKMEESFTSAINESYITQIHKLQNEQDKIDAMGTQIDIFTDYMVGTMVGILSKYASTVPEYEERIVELVRDKFDRIRTVVPYLQGEENGNIGKS